MKLLEEIILSVRSYFKAIDYINEQKLWAYVLLPGLVNLLVFLGIGVAAFLYSGWLIDYFNDLLGTDTESSWNTLAQFLLALVIRVVTFLIYLKMYRYTVLILLAPVLAMMAEKFHGAQTNAKRFRFGKFIKNSLRGVLIALNNLCRELAITALLLLLALLLPIIGVVVPPLIFCVESYYYGFSMVDYFNELEEMSAAKSRRFIWSHAGMALGNGVMFNLILFIPVIGVMIAPMLALTSAHLSLQRMKEA